MSKDNKGKAKDLIPSPFSLKDHLDIPAEAERFQLPEKVVEKEAEDVQNSIAPTLISLHMRVSELRDKLRDIYNIEVGKRNECAICTEPLGSIEEGMAHMRWHHINQAEDGKLSRATILDVENQLFPKVDAELTGVLERKDREELMEALQARRRLINAQLDEVANKNSGDSLDE